MTDGVKDQRTLERARHFPELASLVRGLLAAFGETDAPEIRAARQFVRTHYQGCGVAIAENKMACADCRRAWRGHGGSKA